MKTKSFSKIALLLVLCLTALCAIGITASANETEPVAKIDSANVAYNDMVQLALVVEATDKLPEGAELGIIAWRADVTEFNVATAYYATFTSNEKDGKTYFKTPGIPAPEMDTPIYVAACYRIGNGAIEVAETPFAYSVLRYAGSRLASDNVSAKQAKLYEDLIAYGMSSDEVLEGNANYAFVKAINGTIGSAGATIGGWTGKEVLLRAESINGDGKYFIKWVDADGETVSENRLAYVTAPQSGIATYTAVYGEAVDSPYLKAYNFECLNTGKLSALPTGMHSISNNNGTYNTYSITESANGDKQLYIDRLKSGGSSYGAQVKLPTDVQVTAVEFDLEFTESIANDVLNNMFLYLKDSRGKETKIRLNISYSEAGGNFVLYMEGSPWAYILDDEGKNPIVYAPEGSTVTFSFALDLDNIRDVPVEVVTSYKKDADGNYLDADGNITTDTKKYVAETTETYTSYTCDLLVYVNGKYYGKRDLNDCNKDGFYKKAAQTFDAEGVPSFLLDKDTTLTTSFGIASLNAASKDISIDNPMYYDLID